MERGSINGIPCWLKASELGGGERTIIKEAPGINGATIEVQGQHPQRFRLEFDLIRDGEWVVEDPEAATLSLRAMLLEGGPFSVIMPMFGEVDDLWLASPYLIRFYDYERQAISSGSFELVQGRSIVVLQENAAATVNLAISQLSQALAQDFGRRMPATGLSEAALDTLGAGFGWADAVMAAIGAAFGPVNAVTAALANLAGNVETLLNAPQNFVSQLLGAWAALCSLIPSLSKDDSDDRSAASGDLASDKPTNTIVTALEEGADFDSDLPPTQAEQLGDNASVEDLAEQDEVNACKTVVLGGIATGICLATTSTNFATVESVQTLADALEPVFEELFEIEDIDHRVYANSYFLWKATLAFLAAEAAKLPRLVTITVGRDTDALSILPDLYDSLGSEDEVQLAVDSLCALNPNVDPSNIHKGARLRYLNPLIA